MKNIIKFKQFHVVLMALLLVGLSIGCGHCNTTNDDFPVVVFSDVHFDPFYDPSPYLFQALVTAEATEWANIFKTSSIKTPAVWGNDANYPLFALALSSIRQNLGKSPFIVFTGDILSHDFAQTFYSRSGISVPPSPADIASMESFANKTVAFFLEQVRSSVGNIPVLFAVGNNESYNDQGPDSIFLANTAELFYTNLVKNTVDHQAFLDTFLQGGYYSAELPGTNLTVVSLNTVMFAPPPDGNIPSSEVELAWLDSTLASAKARGKTVWLLIHIPPGAKIIATSQHVDINGHITPATTKMMWNPNIQASFLQILSKYPGLITLKLAGHTHMDEYRIMAPDNVLSLTPGITSYSNNNPAFKIFTIYSRTLAATDYTSLHYDLATNPAQFNNYYTFSTSYAMQGPLDNSLAQLWPELVTDEAKQVLYRTHYYSGHAYSTSTFNPITNKNWPVFWSGMGKMEQQEFIDTVNTY
ncbi:MAG: metallophosphoesterase [Candidatus Saganbacteria bacterium]|nr:metallophosphoesterase [Candidatus Saganbacteria bacterium]